MNRNKSKSRINRTMPMVYPNAAAIDVGATMHMAAVRADRAPEPVRSFGTFTTDLHQLVDWFTECGVETVVMESTGVYWIPIFELLDARGFTVFLVNAHHVVGDITGATGLRIIRAILAGERDPEALACLRHPGCHASAETIARALTGNYRSEHLFALEQAPALYDTYHEKALAATCGSKPC